MNFESTYELARPQVAAWSLFDKTRLPLLTILFIGVNILDIVMTTVLLGTGAFRESNPLAHFVLFNYGLVGMIWFKLIFVAGIVLIAQFVASRKENTARWLLLTGTTMVGGVVAYSGWLFTAFLQMLA